MIKEQVCGEVRCNKCGNIVYTAKTKIIENCVLCVNKKAKKDDSK